MTLADPLVLLAAGTAAGLASTVFSLASLVSYPVLLALGLPPLTANGGTAGDRGAGRGGAGGQAGLARLRVTGQAHLPMLPIIASFEPMTDGLVN